MTGKVHDNKCETSHVLIFCYTLLCFGADSDEREGGQLMFYTLFFFLLWCGGMVVPYHPIPYIQMEKGNVFPGDCRSVSCTATLVCAFEIAVANLLLELGDYCVKLHYERRTYFRNQNHGLENVLCFNFL